MVSLPKFASIKLTPITLVSLCSCKIPPPEPSDDNPVYWFPHPSLGHPKGKSRQAWSKGGLCCHHVTPSVASHSSSAMDLGVGPALQSSQLSQLPWSLHLPQPFLELLPLLEPSQPSQWGQHFESAKHIWPSQSSYFTQSSVEDDVLGGVSPSAP